MKIKCHDGVWKTPSKEEKSIENVPHPPHNSSQEDGPFNAPPPA